MSPTTMPIGDLPGYRQVFAEDFNTSAPTGRFSDVYRHSWEPYDEDSKYSASRVLSAHDGVQDFALDGQIGAAGVYGPPATRWGRLHGRFSMRFKAVDAFGNGAAIMLWPSSNVWGDGEMDLWEGDFQNTITINHHGIGCVDCSAAIHHDTGRRWTDWHVGTVEWTPSAARYYLDEALVLTVTTDVPDTFHRWTIQMAPTATERSAPGHLLVDWVTSYDPV